MNNKRLSIIAVFIGLFLPLKMQAQNQDIIDFEDDAVKAVCVANWDANGDGEMSWQEVSNITDLGKAFTNNTQITRFFELEFFQGLTSIADSAFMGCTNLQEVMMPQAITRIGGHAFDGCGRLMFAEIPEMVTTIGDYAYQECTSVTSLFIPFETTSISNSAFRGCSNLEYINVSEQNTIYDSRNECNALIETSSNTLVLGCKNTVIPNTVVTIGTWAFYECDFEQVLQIPSSIKVIEQSAFNSASGIGQVSFPEGLEEIKDWAFNWCDFESLTLPSTLKNLGYGSFGHNNIQSVTIPASVTLIGYEPFMNNHNLETIVVESGNTVYSSPDNCNAIIDNFTLSLRQGCNTTVIPDNVKSILWGAFEGMNGLTSIEIPESVTAISDYAFAYCPALIEVRSYIITPFELRSSAFSSETYEKATLFVRTGTKATYQNTEAWNRFANIEEFGNPVAGEPEPYTVLSNNNTVLTFYYDDQKATKNGMGVGPFEDSGKSINSGWYDVNEMITTVVFDDSFANCTTLTSTAYWFEQCENLTTIIGINNLKTDNVTDVNSMFIDCHNIKSIDLSSLNFSNVTNMHQMFEDCRVLESINLNGVNTENVTDMSDLFLNCHNLKSIDLSSFNTSNVTNMSHMFCRCDSLTTVHVDEGWTTMSVTNSERMFERCTKIVGGQGTRFDENHIDAAYAHIDGGTANPGYFTRSGDKPWTEPSDPEPYAVLSDNNTILTFYYDDQKDARNGMDIGPFEFDYDIERERELINSGWDEQRESITNVIFDASFANCTSITSTYAWFYKCNHLTTITGIGNLKTDNVTDMSSMFNGCSALTSLDLSGFNTANVTNMTYMFQGCSNLTSLDLSHFNTANVTNMESMFRGCSSLANLDISGFNTGKVGSMGSMFLGCSSLANLDVSRFNTEGVVDMGSMFQGCSNLTSLDLSGFNTANVTKMWTMFSGCSSLTSLDLSGFRTENVTLMGGMFYGCSNLTNLDVSGFQTENVTQMQSMFSGCSSLTSLDLSNFRTDNATIMNAMFNGCSGLTSLDVSAFKTDSVTDMSLMFQYCSSLTSLDVSGFNTEHVLNMLYMFQGCSSLTNLDLSGFNTNNVTDMTSMFGGCSNLTTIFAGEGWSTANVNEGTSMFYDCTNLVGGQGTLYDQNHADVAYAHIDGGTSNPGYFTDKNAPAPAEAEPYAVLSDNNTVLTFYYDEKKAERNGIDVGPFYGAVDDNNNWYVVSSWYEHRERITNVVFDTSFANCLTLTTTAYWFYGFKNLLSITGINNLKTDNVTDMYGMFWGCSGLTNLDVSGFNTDNVQLMERMFLDCSSLTNLDVSRFKTDNVTSMGSMFEGCSGLTSIDVSGFKTDKVWDMSAMFYNCSSLKSLDLSGFKTDNVTYIAFMFYGCSGLTTLDLSSFKTNKVTDMNNLFYNCSSLQSLDLSGFKTDNVTNMDMMFYGCSSLINIDISNFNMSNIPSWNTLFTECRSLASIQADNANIPAEEYANIGNPNLLVYVNDASLAPEGVQNVVINGHADEIILTNATTGNNNWNCPQAFTAEKITYTREFRQQTEVGISRGWESITLPFNVQSITHESKGQIVPFGAQGTGVKYFWLRGYSPEGLHNATAIEANKPYVISMPNNTVVYPDEYNLNGRITFSAENTTVPATPELEEMVVLRGDIAMMPNYRYIPQNEYIYAINVGLPRERYAEGSVFTRNLRDIRPFEAYTTHADVNGARPNNIRIAPQPKYDITGIKTLESDAAEEGPWYSLDGRQMQTQPTRKGVYIQKGKVIINNLGVIY